MHVDEIKTALQDVFPGMIDWLPTDREFIPVGDDEVLRMIDKHYARDVHYVPSLCECEEFALFMLADIRRERCSKADTMLPIAKKNWAIGEALGSRWNGVDMRHHALCFVDEHGKVWLADPRSKEVWPAVKGEDDIFFVRM